MLLQSIIDTATNAVADKIMVRNDEVFMNSKVGMDGP
jgi:hypothetical protein